ncbi:hypothetical protein C8R45DRAFT_1044216 [Mycena sanguinolenta]|nr:hypothetical protein C8R45DRAFT_1044216 [Mycena sanguinolenta]
MKLSQIFAFVLSISGLYSAALSIQEKCANATVTDQSSFISQGGQEILITTTFCPDHYSAAGTRPELAKRQDDSCIPDDQDVEDCRNNEDCQRDSQQPAPDGFPSDCDTLISALDGFIGTFTILAGQTITLTLGSCTVSFKSGGGQISGICGSSWSEIVDGILSRCIEENMGGDTTCGSGLYNINVLPIF